MRLELTKRNWWQEIDQAKISPLVKEKLRGAVAAYLHKLIPPVISKTQFRTLKKSIKSINLDGKPLQLVMKKDRLKFQPVSVVEGYLDKILKSTSLPPEMKPHLEVILIAAYHSSVGDGGILEEFIRNSMNIPPKTIEEILKELITHKFCHRKSDTGRIIFPDLAQKQALFSVKH